MNMVDLSQDPRFGGHDVAASVLGWSDEDVRLFFARMATDEKLLRRWEIRKRARARKRRRGWR